MKKIILSLLILAFVNIYAQESFKVIRVNGTIVNEKSNSNLSAGSVFTDNDKLTFGNSSSRAAVINSKGRYILASNSSANAYAKSFLTPAMSNMSSRSGAIVNIVDLKNHFSGNYLIFKTSEVKISKDNFPMDENHFFFIRYDYKGESINKQLKFVSDTLVINKSELMMINGIPIPNPNVKNMKIFYFDKIKNIPTEIGAFNPVFVNEDELKTEVSILIEGIPSKTKGQKIDEVLSYINDFYGKPDKENLTEWLESNFKL